MKAEIGFIVDWDSALQTSGQPTNRMNLVVTSQTSSEITLLKMFARRSGLKFNEYDGELIIEEPTDGAVDLAGSGKR